MKTLPVHINNNAAPYWSKFLFSLSKNTENFMTLPNWTDVIENELAKYSAKLTVFNSILEFEQEEYSSLFLIKYS
jgi:hypothetical protein